eukprot:Gb_00690 [translate_table: standard]
MDSGGQKQMQGLEPNAGDSNCTGDQVPEFSPLSASHYRWPLRDISNLFSTEVGDLASENDPPGTNTPALHNNSENSPSMQRNSASPRTPPGSNRGNSALRRGFR